MALLEALQAVPLLKGLSAETIGNILLPKSRCQTYPAQAVIYGPQDKVTDVHILLEGKVNLVTYSDSGSRDLRSQLYAGDIVGLDLIATKSQISPYRAETAGKATIVSFPAKVVLEPGILPEEQRLTCLGQLLQQLSQINMKKEYRLAILTHRSIRQRIWTYLTMQAGRRQADTFTIPFSREELASFLCVNRSALSHELSQMAKEGWITFHKNTFTILRRERSQYDKT